MTTFYLLLGAGFSRNWGGWLANEAFEYLLSHPMSMETRRVLVENRARGFEGALAVLQQQAKSSIEHRRHLSELEQAISSMFDHMNEAFIEDPWFHSRAALTSVPELLSRFDAIFTLNQDLLLERNYLTRPTGEYIGDRWQANHLPGLSLPARVGPDDNIHLRELSPREDGDLELRSDFQPIYKLHGSTNWRTRDSKIMIMGADKAGSIGHFPLLQQYMSIFESSLHDDNARLLIIGYGFRDTHINSVIEKASQKTLLRTFIVDPLGLDVLDPYYGTSAIRGPNHLMDAVVWRSLGASRRNFRDILERDRLENKKLMRFFEA